MVKISVEELTGINQAVREEPASYLGEASENLTSTDETTTL